MASKKHKIVVHEKALAHLSRGLYRSPASALRELISNGWDANAKSVHIDTNYPTFFQVSVRDDGDGFAKEEFERLMAGNIGNSEKRPKDKKLINGRPTIGRLGIGMLGIAQICGSFKVTSKPKKGEAFCARINLYDLLKERLDSKTSDLVRTKVEKGPDDEKIGVKEVDVGDYEYLEFDPESLSQGTIIVTEGVHPTFVQTFVESTQLPEFFEPGLDWAQALEKMEDVRSLQQLGDYWRLIWELSACCPIPYLSKDSLPNHLARDDQELLVAYDFNVFVDGMKLAKPLNLHGNPNGYTSRKIKPREEQLYGKTLGYHGYLLVQEAKQLHPDELRGIMIRIKGVGIGYYDPSMLDYRNNEGPRSRWLTGEIFVTSGLEDALNIDRDSFNKFHPQYRAIQKYIHELLQTEIFVEVYRNIDVRTKAKQAKKTKDRREHFRAVVLAKEGSAVKVKFDTPKSEEGPAVVTNSKGVEVHVAEPASIPTKKANRELAANILAVFDLAMQEPTIEKRREYFESTLLELLKKW